MPVYPRPNLDPNAAPWGAAVDKRLDAIERASALSAQEGVNANKQQNSTINALNRQLAVLAAQQTTLADQQATLAAQQAVLASYQVLRYAGSDTMVNNFSGWYTGSVPTVNLTSDTGRIEVGYGGALNGGSGYFCYQIVRNDTGAIVVNRATILASASRRVAVTGGASFTPSGYRTEVVTVPAGVPLSVSVQINAIDTFVNFFGYSIQARVTP